MTHHLTTLADQAATAVHELAHLTRPAITTLEVSDLRTLAGALAELAAGLPQTLHQLSSYLSADSLTAAQGQCTDDQGDRQTAIAHARTPLRQASTAAAHLAAALEAAYQTLGDLAETTESEPKGVNFRPAIRGQFSGGVDRFRQATGTAPRQRIREGAVQRPATPTDRAGTYTCSGSALMW